MIPASQFTTGDLPRRLRKLVRLRAAQLRRSASCLLVCTFLSALAACDRSPTDADTRVNERSSEDIVLARVDREPITVGYLERAILATSRTEQVEYVSPPQLREFLETSIDRKLMARRARAAGIDVTPELADSVNALPDDAYRREQVLAEAYLDARLAQAVDVSADAVEAYYAANLDEFTVPERARITRVVLPTAAAGEHIRELLSRGLSADEITNQADDTVASAVVWVQRRAESGPMAEIAFALDEGDVSEPFRIATGFAIIRLDERVPESVRPLNEVRDGIAARLEQQQRTAALADLRVELRRGVDISVDEQALAGYNWQP